MTTIFIRTILIYLILIAAMRLMGKRQIGELEVSELITTLMLSELATLPIENQKIPLIHAVIPIVTLLTLEVLNSMILTKIPRLKNLVSAKPSVLIRRGAIEQKELSRIRMSIDELITELRRQGVTSIDEVEYAILEQNGKLTVILKANQRQPTLAQLGLKTKENGIAHIILADGYLNRHNLDLIGRDEAWLEQELRARHCTRQDAFLFTVDDAEKIILIKKENSPSCEASA